MSRILRTRVKRTRPSMAWPTILIDNVDFLSSYKDFQPKAESSMIVPSKKKQKKLTVRRKKKRIPRPQTPENAEEIKKINAFFDDVDDYEFVIEEIKEDKWVMDASISSTKNADASDFLSDASIWTNNRTPDRRKKSATCFAGRTMNFQEDNTICHPNSSCLFNDLKQKSVEEDSDEDEKRSEEVSKKKEKLTTSFTSRTMTLLEDIVRRTSSSRLIRHPKENTVEEDDDEDGKLSEKNMVLPRKKSTACFTGRSITLQEDTIRCLSHLHSDATDKAVEEDGDEYEKGGEVSLVEKNESTTDDTKEKVAEKEGDENEKQSEENEVVTRKTTCFTDITTSFQENNTIRSISSLRLLGDAKEKSVEEDEKDVALSRKKKSTTCFTSRSMSLHEDTILRTTSQLFGDLNEKIVEEEGDDNEKQFEKDVESPRKKKSTTCFIDKIANFREDNTICRSSSSRLSDEPKSMEEENDEDEKQSEESEALVVGNDLYYLLHACGQRSVRLWEDFCFSSRKCKKLGEGTYGEVYKTDVRDRQVALKVVPFVCDEINSSRLVNGERMKSAMEILPELLITMDLSALSEERDGQRTSGFVCLVQAAVVQGEYPETLLNEWDKFAKAKETLNDRPDEYSTPQQLFITFALSLGGKDLEAYTIRSEKECFSILFQIAFSLAVAEEVLQFEHRDLHVGNVLIDQCKAGEQIRCVLNGEKVILRSCGVRAAIIDFTNSRMQRDKTIIYLDLSKDEELFTGDGDYQFEIYRMMRKNNNNDWKGFHPYTNLLWLHYLATKLFATKKIMPRRRHEVMKEMDRMLNFERIKQFLADKAITAFLADYVM